MRKNAGEVAAELLSLLRINKKKALTLDWDEFYEIAGRKRLRDEFTSEVENEIFRRDGLIAYGKTCIVVCYDSLWSITERRLSEL